MSKSPESDFDLELHFLPAWAQQPPDPNRYAQYAGEADRGERRGDQRERRPRRRDDPNRPQRQPSRRGPTEAGPTRPGRGRDGGAWRGSRGRPERKEPPPLPDLSLVFTPDDKGVESLAKQIKATGRAYPLFDIAQMILRKPERHRVRFSTKKKPDGQPAQPLFLCALDETLWLSEDEAVHYVLDRHFSTFYQAERTATEGPKGTYTFVAQCGMSGAILGPPNHHDYQNQLRKLHAERFSHMPFDAFKARVRIVRDEAVVKKWVDDQSWKTEYICLNMTEPLKLGSREAVEQHFREVHLPNIIKQVEDFELAGTACLNLKNSGLNRLVRHCLEEQRRFPLQTATTLSQQFAGHGLQFFKVNRSITHVAVARPRYLDLEAAPVSENVKRIVIFVRQNPKSTRRQVLEALAPAPAPAAPPADPATEPSPEVVADPSAPPTPEQTAIIADLHWLIHQGHVIEFANGLLETAKRPVPKPEKPPSPPPSASDSPEPLEAPAGSEPAESVTPSSSESVTAAAPTQSAAAEREPEPVVASPTPEPETIEAESEDRPVPSPDLPPSAPGGLETLSPAVPEEPAPQRPM